MNAKLGTSTMPLMKAILHKYNGQLALALILAMIVSTSMQLVHDQLVDHDHGIECPMFVVDGSSPLPEAQSQCVRSKQLVQTVPFTPVALVLSTLEKQQARAPPISH